MNYLSGTAPGLGYSTFTLNDTESSIFGLGHCYDGFRGVECRLCFETGIQKLKTCIPATSGRIYLDRCFIRYDNYNFYNEFIDPKYDVTICGSPSNALSNDTYMVEEFDSKLNQAITKLIDFTTKRKGSGTVQNKGGLITIHAGAQCWKTISDESCKECLTKAGEKIKKCTPRAEGRVGFTGCVMKYSTNRFYPRDPNRNHHVLGQRTILGMVVASTIMAIVATIVAFLSYRIIISKKKDGGLDDIPATGNKTDLSFKYEILEKATNSFDESRKLGQGGAGSVFKGVLPNGQTVAVKRLFFNTRQWVDQFFNEVNSISGVQHKNLVRLLGCSIEGPESLLVYEYVPNRSLDQILFVKKISIILTWSQRFNIVCGISKGLAYLHGGSGVKIIHRDIKSSNILLDENLTPKIADFGLARCVAPDKTHVSTAIAGTLGYMAPEYLVRGQLTEKADVYAFGVLVLEIATGRKNTVFSQGSSSILYSVWKHYKDNKITEAIDSSLNGKFNKREASNVLLIGLLCTQASVALRPSMAEVDQMMSDANYEIPSPKQPPFLNASVLSPEETVSISFMGSLDLEIGQESSSDKPGNKASPDESSPV
ncbi:hypothetical protein COLO4_30091 [Corchorus olitorius]|uniref:Protein kinase domain-containing protein n=1 Tax=Corchorus olitorius TaxID=93759 RepID=A0A1R3HB93_9ROSI|nr:hypothetical protein COLO4_30091 [Corchorus olitorius]